MATVDGLGGGQMRGLTHTGAGMVAILREAVRGANGRHSTSTGLDLAGAQVRVGEAVRGPAVSAHA